MRLPFFSEYSRYFKIIKSHTGWEFYGLIIFSFLCAMMEGIGITMLLPLLKVSDVSSNNLSGSSDYFFEIFEVLNIPFTFTFVLLAMCGVFLMKGILKFVEGMILSNVTSNLLARWKAYLIKLYKGLDYQYYTSKNSGHFTNVINTQTYVAMQFVRTYVGFSSRVLTILIYFVFAFLLSWQFTLTALISGLFIILTLKGLSVKTKKLSLIISSETSHLNKFLIQFLQFFKYLKATSSFPILEEQALLSIKTINESMKKSGYMSAFMVALQEPLAVLFMVGIMLYHVEIVNAPLEPILVSLILFYRSMNTMMLAQSQWQQTMHLVGGIEILDVEFKEVLNYQEKNNDFDLPEFNSIIDIKNIDFSYSGGKGVFKNMDLTVKKNSTIAIVGESGSGKSTLIDILSLLLNIDGGIFDIDGVSVKQLNRESWRKQIGLVSQDTVIFDDSILNNITLWKGNYEMDKLVRKKVDNAAKRAFCYDLIQELPEGFQTRIGERGIRLSGGQKQRIAIARELYKKPTLLILDEATSALDSESERYIQQSIDKLKGQVTVLIIAHRLSTIKNADKILVLSDGQIIEQGTFEELTNRMSNFKRMVEMQQF